MALEDMVRALMGPKAATDQPQRMAGDVVPLPMDPMYNIRMWALKNRPDLIQRGLVLNPQTGQWEDQKAKILPMTPTSK